MHKWPTVKYIGLLAFGCPILVGIIYMAMAAAPKSYIAANAGALVLVFIANFVAPYLRGRHRPGTHFYLVVAGVILVLLAGTFAGPSVSGVNRWIGLGPIDLHAAMLLLPSLVVILTKICPKRAFAITAIASLIFALQPDRASAIALCVSSFVIFAHARDRWTVAALFTAMSALIYTILTPDLLAPVAFVESVVPHAAGKSLVIAIFMVGTITLSALAPFIVRDEASLLTRTAWSACLAGYFMASMTGHYPTPLLGYGMSPVLGFGIAFAMLFSLDNTGIPATPEQPHYRSQKGN